MITKKELAGAYCVHRNTLARKLNEIGINKAGRLSPKELEKIFEEFGEPQSIKKPLNFEGFKAVG
jgi:hypothetical protein